MRLNSIKLAGFKSFVDPTTIDLDEPVSVVVGPNGCGKSNILDAIRWVIGESSAQRLRGEVISDFIFDGSASRAPSSRASVELVFDNSDGRVGGEYASYGELSVRREVTDEAKSSYFLNGQRCLRRDVQDVFLGTGFGTRGYSIVQQDLISQLVNSNPDTLREHLEEAAGVSKYRVRRHETLNRIAKTNQNLSQVRISQNELEREIRQLKRQATQALRFQEYNNRLNVLQAKLLRRQIEEKEQNRNSTQTLLNEIDEHLRKQNETSSGNDSQIASLEKRRSEQQSEKDSVSRSRFQADAAVDALATRLNEIEEQLQGNRTNIESKLRQLGESLQLLESDVARQQTTRTQKQSAQRRLDEITVLVDDARAKYESANQDADTAITKHAELATQLNGKETEQSNLVSQRRVDLASVESLDVLIKSVGVDESDVSEHETTISEYEKLTKESRERHDNLEGDLRKLGEELADAQSNRAKVTTSLASSRQTFQDIRDELLALEALREATMAESDSSQELTAWLNDVGLSPEERVGDLIDVEKGWEHVIEVVVGSRMRGIVSKNFESNVQQVDRLQASDVLIFDANENQDTGISISDAEPLESKLKASSQKFGSLLRGVAVAENVAQAMQIRERLAEHESVVTADGIWLAKNWLWVFRASQSEPGVIERGRRADSLKTQLTGIEEEIATLETQHSQVTQTIDGLIDKREQLQSQLSESSSRLAGHQTLLNEYTNQLAEKRQINASAEETRKTRQEDLKQREARIESAGVEIDRLVGEINSLTKELSNAEQSKSELVAIRETQAAKLDEILTERREIEFELDQSEQALTHIADSAVRQDQLVTQLLADLSRLMSEDRRASDGVPDIQSQLTDRRSELERFDSQLARCNEALQATESELDSVRSAQQSLQREREETNERRLQRLNDFNRLDLEINQLQSNLDDLDVSGSEEGDEEEIEADVTEIESEIVQLQERMKRLGLINYRANEELESRVSDKEQLDGQISDLEQALETLNQAIQKIDGETVKNMKETFDAVNTNLQHVFRTLFGGGSASLELTDSDILEAGIQVRAQPPGKRNSTISMLSGGERAMTAIAFIFALFNLKPSPVCILDEVDAPLDERNVSKFTELLAGMSRDTQFVIITHNPATMELAGNLLGVTMEEAGVSRIVSVNLEAAFQMASNNVASENADTLNA